MEPKYDRSVERINVINTMKEHGGSFVQALADAFLKADSENFQKLISVFSEYWNKYAALWTKLHLREHKGYVIRWHGGTEYEWISRSYCGGTDEHVGAHGWGESFEECMKAIDEEVGDGT